MLRIFRKLLISEPHSILSNDNRWLRFWYSMFWHYDVLRGLDYLRNARIKPDSRIRDAIETVVERRHQNGRPLNLLHSEHIPLLGQAAGTRSAPSKSYGGTASMRLF